MQFLWQLTLRLVWIVNIFQKLVLYSVNGKSFLLRLRVVLSLVRLLKELLFGKLDALVEESPGEQLTY